MIRLTRQVIPMQNFVRIFARSMGKVDQFKWKPHKKKPNKKPKFSVILKEPMDGLGNSGQLVEVERGYARNFLIPQAKAVYATPENKERFLVSSEDAAKTDPEAQVSSRFMRFLNRLHLKIERKEGNIAVTEHNISQEYQRQHQLVVPTHCIELSGPLTKFGDYTINVSVRDGVSVPMRVTVEEWKPRIANRWKDVLAATEQSSLQS
ncbi:predicted protein [Nematostella vectensis]|uniref:Large ribosomal subunit protein bL9m n=2 Tax=Nematostella vectensis TaxID=45351 RepID=A7S9U8_NEMVE|nr:predicted protein [Nematostella vectensis]|eukprot:XP_001631549.1 predicted protein [Nematostella vectensis]